MNISRHPIPTKEHVKMLTDDLDDTQASLERLINRTPTSEDRNAMCDANIHVMAAIDKLKGLRL